MNLGQSIDFHGLNFRMFKESTLEIHFTKILVRVESETKNRVGRIMLLPIIVAIGLNEP